MRPSRQVSVIIIVVAVLWSGAKGSADQQWTLTLFLTPECARNEEAVRAVRGFLHRHRDISGKGVLIAELEEVSHFIPHAKTLFGQGLTFTVSTAAAQEHGITETPAIVFQQGDRRVWVTGVPDLEEVWQSIVNAF